MFAAAGEKYDAALKIKPDKHEALNNWGTALSDQAKTKEGGEADALFAAAGEKYDAALKIKPDFHEALNNWGVCLIDRARSKGLEVSTDFLDQAWQKCELAESHFPGRGAYNLACIACLRNAQDDCRQWLKVCREYNQLPAKEHLQTDADLENVRDLDWFQQFVAES